MELWVEVIEAAITNPEMTIVRRITVGLSDTPAGSAYFDHLRSAKRAMEVIDSLTVGGHLEQLPV